MLSIRVVGTAATGVVVAGFLTEADDLSFGMPPANKLPRFGGPSFGVAPVAALGASDLLSDLMKGVLLSTVTAFLSFAPPCI